MNIIDQVKQTLIEEIEASIRKANLAEDIPEIKIEIPKDTKNGDYSSNIAMVLTKLLSVIHVKLRKLLSII